MRSVAHDGVVLDVCDACGGLWLSEEDVIGLVGPSAPGANLLTEPELSSTLACPRCDGAPPLYEVGMAGVAELELHTCKACEGLFVPRDESEAVVRLLKWHREEGDETLGKRLTKLLELIRGVAETYGPGGDDRPSWNEL